MLKLVSILVSLAALAFAVTFLDFSSNAKPISTWGAICTSQPNQLDCCLKMLDACRKGCAERGNCPPNACESHYNRCLQRRTQGSSTDVKSGTSPTTSTRP